MPENLNSEDELKNIPIRLVSWHAFALGEKFISLYPFRIQEDNSRFRRCGIMEKEGSAFHSRDGIFVQAVGEMRELRRYYHPETKVPDVVRNRQTAVLWDPWQIEAFSLDYRALKRMGSKVHFLIENATVSSADFPFLVAGVDMACKQEWSVKLGNYVRQGGQLILLWNDSAADSLFGVGKEENRKRIGELTGFHWSPSDSVWNAAPLKIKTDSATIEFTAPCCNIAGGKTVHVLFSYTRKQETIPAVLQQKSGKGTITAFGCSINDPEIKMEIFSKLWTMAGVRILQLPPGVFMEWRDGFWVALNYSSRVYRMDLGHNTKILLGQSTISPGELCIWRKD